MGLLLWGFRQIMSQHVRFVVNSEDSWLSMMCGQGFAYFAMLNRSKNSIDIWWIFVVLNILNTTQPAIEPDRGRYWKFKNNCRSSHVYLAVIVIRFSCGISCCRYWHLTILVWFVTLVSQDSVLLGKLTNLFEILWLWWKKM